MSNTNKIQIIRRNDNNYNKGSLSKNQNMIKINPHQSKKTKNVKNDTNKDMPRRKIFIQKTNLEKNNNEFMKNKVITIKKNIDNTKMLDNNNNYKIDSDFIETLKQKDSILRNQFLLFLTEVENHEDSDETDDSLEDDILNYRLDNHFDNRLTQYNDQFCPICQDIIVLGESINSLPCFHHFHRDCISSWLKKKSVCPLCNIDSQKTVY